MSGRREIERAAKLILDARHVVALTGAGISTPSGIPDFRSPGSGLWESSDELSVASLSSFVERPASFYDWVRPLAKQIMCAEPNAAHRALAELETMGRLQTVITQNFDELQQRAGSTHVLEVHGHMRKATCIRCYHMAPGFPLMSKFVEDGIIPTCEVCGGVMKPNVVLFGEMLPVGVMYEADQESRSCDLMLVAGSSLEVAPASDLPFVAKENGAFIIVVNKTPTIADSHAAVVLHEDVAVALPKIVEAVKKQLAP
ncbi:MAG: NAD-dependent deacylase [Chloroflexi bacterium]|nr:NAD-dependent deacylase [Chloroflexota bacterium]